MSAPQAVAAGDGGKASPAAAIAITVYGLPAPQGSKRHVGRGIMVESSKAVKPWREAVKHAALNALDDREPLTGPVEIRVTFTFPRPKHHYRTGKHSHELRNNAPTYVATRPDVDKTLRSCLDALTGLAFRDDAQVVRVAASKVYGPRPGAHIAIGELA